MTITERVQAISALSSDESSIPPDGFHCPLCGSEVRVSYGRAAEKFSGVHVEPGCSLSWNFTDGHDTLDAAIAATRERIAYEMARLF